VDKHEDLVKQFGLDQFGQDFIASCRKVTMSAKLDGLHRKKSRALRILTDISDTSPEFYCKWLNRAVAFAEKGYVSEALCQHLKLSLNWLEYSERDYKYKLIKRFFELSLVVIFFLSVGIPLFLLVAIFIKLESKGPLFFKQLRLGRMGQPFWIYKFRTMKSDAEELSPTNVVPIAKFQNDSRMTNVGRILRKYKIDELPQLINVVRGEMSLIGPRPYSIDESLCIESRYFIRFASRPGMTGLWQAFRPYPSNPKLKLRLDAMYIKKQGPLLDLRIMVQTLLVVLKGEPRNQSDCILKTKDKVA
jgi:lipopolysaccharide/colanic/teichoic acid biosynthesis glycosyltransferase